MAAHVLPVNPNESDDQERCMQELDQIHHWDRMRSLLTDNIRHADMNEKRPIFDVLDGQRAKKVLVVLGDMLVVVDDVDGDEDGAAE